VLRSASQALTLCGWGSNPQGSTNPKASSAPYRDDHPVRPPHTGDRDASMLLP